MIQEVNEAEVPINIDDIIERAFEQAFSRALDQVIQKKAEDLFKKAFDKKSPLSRKLEEKIEEGFRHFIEEGIPWERKRPGFDGSRGSTERGAE